MSKKITIPKSVGYPYANFDVNGKLYKYKSGEEVDVADEVAELVEAIVENQKKPGKEPTGQADYTQNDPMSASYLRNRPFYEEKKKVFSPLNLTWDGNTEGKQTFENLRGNHFYKVSDDIFTEEQIKLMRVSSSDGLSLSLSSISSYNFTEDAVNGGIIYFVRKPGKNEDFGITFPETGVYFCKGDAGYTDSLTSTDPIEHTGTIIHKIDSKFLPDEEIPYFDLTEMGLEPISQQIQSIEGDMTKICGALAKGPVVFRFSIYALDGSIVDSTQVVTAARQDLPGVGVIYQSNEIVVGSPTALGKLYRFIFFVNESGNFMNAISIPLIFATELQLHFSETGNFETARLKMSDGTTVDATRY